MLTHLNPSPAPPARVVILGANGFLSPHLQAILKSHDIAFRVVSSNDIDLTQEGTAIRLATLIQPDDAVVMMSTLTPDKGRDFSTLMRNLRMAENVCLTLAQVRCAHFVYLSSDAVYDAHQIPLDEDSTREPVDLYGLMHTSREMMLGSILKPAKIPFCVLRPSNIYGPGDTHNNYGPNRFVRTTLSEGRIVLFGKGEERRSQVYVDDAITLILRVLLHRSQGTLNIATRPAISFRDVASLISQHYGKLVQIEFAPRKLPVIHRPYKPTQIARFIYNLGRPIGPIVHRTFSVSAIHEAFPDFKFTPVTQGLGKFIEAEQKRLSTGNQGKAST